MARRAIRIECSATEEAILLYLYNDPSGRHSTVSLASALEEGPTNGEIAEELLSALNGSRKPNDSPTVRRTRSASDVQTDIESLIVKKLICGKREGSSGEIGHSDIRLTKEGEREAIRTKNRPRVDWDTENLYPSQ